MRFIKLHLFVLIFPTVVGCLGNGATDVSPANILSKDGLTLSIELPKRHFTVGEEVEVVVTATNSTGKPITINANSSALVLIRILRETRFGPEEVKRYPQAAAKVITPWQLDGGQRRTFKMGLTVEPDWPTSEPLRLTVQLNGVPNLAPGLVLAVSSTKGTPE